MKKILKIILKMPSNSDGTKNRMILSLRE